LEIAVLGGGHGAFAAAVHLTEQGHKVRFWRRNAATFGPVLETRSIKVTDWQGTRDVAIDTATTDLAAAVAGAALIVIPLPCTTHADLSKQLAPHLEDGQVVYLPPGTFGSYLFAKELHAVRPGAKVAFAETGTLPYLARKQAADHVRVSVYATRLPTGVLPSADTDRALDIIGAAYPAVERLDDALNAALMNAGPIIHPPLILMNAGPLEHFDAWDIHNEGTQPSIRRVTDALDAERIQLREALGYGAPHFPLADHYDDSRDEWMYGNASHERLTDSGDWREKIDLHTHRYMVEDTALGLSFLASLGRWADVKMPIVEGFLAIAAAITGQDLYGAGRTLENMGLAGLDRAQMTALLKNGLTS